MSHNIAIAIGHSRTIGNHQDGGALSWDGHENELEFNTGLARRIAAELLVLGIPSTIFDHYEGGGYGAAISWLAREIKKAGCTVAVELHFNSAGPLAHGHEVLYLATSARGKLLAECVNAKLSAHFQTPDRGVKGLRAGDRGLDVCLRTHCPTILSEPFFGSSKEDWLAMALLPDRLAHAMAEGIAEYCANKS
jgi:N-acetylmuramoyl-L-alanine amidase